MCVSESCLIGEYKRRQLVTVERSITLCECKRGGRWLGNRSLLIKLNILLSGVLQNIKRLYVQFLHAMDITQELYLLQGHKCLLVNKAVNDSTEISLPRF